MTPCEEILVVHVELHIREYDFFDRFPLPYMTRYFHCLHDFHCEISHGSDS